MFKDNTEVKGYIKIVGYERGKKVFTREGSNIWTLEGRKYSAMLKTYQSYAPLTPTRQDRIKYIGVGEGIDQLQVFNKQAFVESLFRKPAAPVNY